MTGRGTGQASGMGQVCTRNVVQVQRWVKATGTGWTWGQAQRGYSTAWMGACVVTAQAWLEKSYSSNVK